MLAPPDREAGEPGADHLGRHLQRLLVGGAGDVLGARLAAEDRAERGDRLRLHLPVDRLRPRGRRWSR